MIADRLSPVDSLTADERERARLAYAEMPSLLDAAVQKALDHIEHGERLAEAIVARVRRVAP